MYLQGDIINPIDLSNIPQFCRYLSELSPQPMVAVEGTTHVVTYLNPAFAQLVGKQRQELIGRPFAEAVPEGEANGCLALLDRVFRTGLHENLAEQEHRQIQPQPAFWSYAVWAILGPDDRPAGVMIQVTDSTDVAVFRQHARAINSALLVSGTQQHELADAAKSLSGRLQVAIRTRDHFLAVLSHELRTPMATLSAGLQVLKIAGTNPEHAESSRAIMERQLKLLVRLVDDLLDVSRITTGKLELRKEPVDLATVVRDAVEGSRPLIDRLGHELTVTLPQVPIPIDADPIRLGQVFLNLLNNAAKYTEPGGRIWLTVERDGAEAVVRVRDTGIGILDIHLPQIFDVFVQVDTAWQRVQGGLGIGLSLVKELVALHGGRVEARSEGLGRGSEFIVRLPAANAASEAAPTPAQESTWGPARRILVVDDNQDIADSLALMLRIMGHEVHLAHDGEAAVAAVEEFRPELVLMDLGMPKLNGYEAAIRIRAEPWGKRPQLVALTGWGGDEDRRRTQAAGFDSHLVKPVDPTLLARMIATLPSESLMRTPSEERAS